MNILDQHDSAYLRIKLKELGYSSYSAYLDSELWRRFKDFYAQKMRHRNCAACDKFPAQLHHKTYKRLGSERISDVVYLCGTCHSAVHTLAIMMGKGELVNATEYFIEVSRRDHQAS